ncbi:hypothetical protein FOA52_004881 [Chlamydomonas sp. UWO 241]|nr:hypothetical protein FOA52_004881 [Chlamydomonas sp. UWO 241]
MDSPCYPHLATQIGTANSSLGGVRGNTSVCIVAAGGNDLQELNNPYVILNSAVNPGAPVVAPGVAPTAEQLAQAQQVYLGNIVSTLAKFAGLLATDGLCDRVIVQNMPPMHRVPNTVAAITTAVKKAVAASFQVCPPYPTPCPGYDARIEQYSAFGIAAAIAGAKAAVVGINDGLAQAISSMAAAGMPVSLFDAYALLTDILDDPATYGFTNTSAPCMVSSAPINDPSATLISTCSDPDKFVSWDGLHPTAPVHALFGAKIAAALKGVL